MKKYISLNLLGLIILLVVMYKGEWVQAKPLEWANETPTPTPIIDRITGKPIDSQMIAVSPKKWDKPAATVTLPWVKYIHNPVLSPGPVGSWDSSKVSLSSVIADVSGYKLWYSGNNNAIGYATSSDGLNWTKYANNPVLTPGQAKSWDGGYIIAPHVIFHQGIYKMWYRGTMNADDSNLASIGYATSTDGVNWVKYAGNPIFVPNFKKKLWSATIMVEGNNYKMWYSGTPESEIYISYATSTDGINWENYPANPVLKLGEEDSWDNSVVYYPYIIFNGSNYEMWYSGNSTSIGYATSPDGISWNKSPNNPIFTPGQKKSWDSDFALASAMSLQNGIYRMWYSGRNEKGISQIGYAFKGGQAVISPTVGGILTYYDDQASATTVELGKGAVNTPITLMLTEISYFTTPPNFRFGGHAFHLDAWAEKILPTFVFQKPVTVTIDYSEADVVGLNEAKLKLYYRNGNNWLDTACGQYIRLPDKNRLTIPICHLSELALLEQIPVSGGQVNLVYLPIIFK